MCPLSMLSFSSSIGSEENPSIQQRWVEGFWQFLGMVSMAVWIQIVGEPLFFFIEQTWESVCSPFSLWLELSPCQ